jgi:hypothetical protein
LVEKKPWKEEEMECDGGPAFPIERHLPDGAECYYGMSLRDYFAAAALQGILANPTWNAAALEQLGVSESRGFAVASRMAFEYADAMIQARGPEGK